MKPYVLLTVLLFSGLGVSVAQQRTRDKLFPTFQQDLSALQQKESKLAAPPARSSRSTKEQLFTDYRPQTATRQGNAGTLNASRASTGKNPSDISAEEAVKTTKARQTTLPATEMSTPTQGNGSEKSNGPIKTVAPAATAPAKTATPTVPVKKSFERKKQ